MLLADEGLAQMGGRASPAVGMLIADATLSRTEQRMAHLFGGSCQNEDEPQFNVSVPLFASVPISVSSSQ
jgi:hypothetical protein